MSKLLIKIAIVLLLVLGIAGAVMSYILFEQREIIKGRTQKLEDAIINIAATVETGDEDGSKFAINREELKIYEPVPGGPQVTMDMPLNQLISGSRGQLNRLNVTRSTLAETRNTLAETDANLKQTRDDLQTARNNITELNKIVTARNQTIGEQEKAVRALEKEKSGLNARITEQSIQITELDAKNKEFETRLENLERENKQLMAIVDKGGGAATLGEGQLGEVVYVDPDWNFCVFGVDGEKIREMLPNIELLIHRGDTFVSKIRIRRVVEPFVIADIMDEWQQTDLQQGDHVITGSLH